MEYGRISADDLEKVDISLPADPLNNKLILKGCSGKARIYMGAPKWGRKEWVGTLYPKTTKESQYLNEYVKRYNAVELNATHYKAYTSDEISKWSGKASNLDFKFCPKVWNQISQYSGFANTEIITAEFLNGVLAFGPQLGPILLQISEKYSPIKKDQLFEYLRSLPADLQYCNEC